ncbi:hypothetical protein FXN65_24235 [Metapseudomonas lalkuanensis]|uniref:Uncharacterized protein n=1 Tax=Metapseudomonas lalkuanensis TaxID=2604832 RepID=A0A5J6QVZ7_9GAMM|nr:hypothetical protein FXN65_24235 [Pseudomonas lalkuanensis]
MRSESWGRAAWMPREACGAMDGPSRRAPGATMEGAPRRSRGRMPGQAFWFLFVGGIPTFAKGTRPARRNQKHPQNSVSSLARRFPATHPQKQRRQPLAGLAPGTRNRGRCEGTEPRWTMQRCEQDRSPATRISTSHTGEREC